MVSSTYNTLKSQIEKIAWITFFWILISLTQFIRGYITLTQFDCNREELNVLALFQGNILTGLIAGLFGGSIMVLFWENWMRTLSYGKALLKIAWSYTLVFIGVAIFSGMFFIVYQQNIPFFSHEALDALLSQTQHVALAVY